MKVKKAAALLRRSTICFALLLTALRVFLLQTAFDKDGLLPRGSVALPFTVLICAAFFVALWVMSLRLNPNPGRESFFSVQGIWLPMKLLAAGLILAGSVLALTEMKQGVLHDPSAPIPLMGIVSALLMIWNSLQERRGAGFFWVRLLPSVFAGAALVLRFRVWSHDPMVIHIFPMLLAWTCCMVEMMLLTGFPLNVGHRRSAVLFGLASGMFTCMTLPDYFMTTRIILSDLLPLLGLSLWGFDAALELLRSRAQIGKRSAFPEK